MNQIELLLRLSEAAQDKGDEIATRQQQERSAHAKELHDLWRMIDLAAKNLEAELVRFGVIVPKAQQLPERPPQGPQQGPVKPVPLNPPGGKHATQTGLEPGNSQREHQRAAPPR